MLQGRLKKYRPSAKPFVSTVNYETLLHMLELNCKENEHGTLASLVTELLDCDLAFYMSRIFLVSIALKEDECFYLTFVTYRYMRSLQKDIISPVPLVDWPAHSELPCQCREFLKEIACISVLLSLHLLLLMRQLVASNNIKKLNVGE